MDKDTVEEKSLQQRIKSNLRQLKATIEKNRDDIETAKEKYHSLLCSPSVIWSEVTKQEAYIESLELGLEKLKGYREIYFPNWKNILIED